MNSAECGMVRMPLYTDIDKEFHQWLIETKGIIDRDDAQLMLSGPGFASFYEFLGAKEGAEVFSMQP